MPAFCAAVPHARCYVRAMHVCSRLRACPPPSKRRTPNALAAKLSLAPTGHRPHVRPDTFPGFLAAELSRAPTGHYTSCSLARYVRHNPSIHILKHGRAKFLATRVLT